MISHSKSLLTRSAEGKAAPFSLCSAIRGAKWPRGKSGKKKKKKVDLEKEETTTAFS